jgi:hypothetical protein
MESPKPERRIIMAADDMAQTANKQPSQHGTGTPGSANSQDSTCDLESATPQDSASTKNAQDVAYQKKVEDTSGRDWTKRRTFRPTGGV